MADSAAVRARRARLHAKGDHSLCRPERCGEAAKVVAINRGVPEAPSDNATSPMVEAYRARLTEAKRVDTPEGQHVLRLAEALSRMSDSASGLASLSRALQAAMDRAMEGAEVHGETWFDEVAKKRRERLGGGA